MPRQSWAFWGLWTLLGLVMNPDALLAQRAPLRWKVVSEMERSLTRYGPDTTASVVILYDYGVWTPQNFDAGKVHLRHHRRFKVLRPAGTAIADQALEVAADEAIKGLQAQTINFVDGKRRLHKLHLKFLPPVILPDGRKRYEFTFPEVTTGSIVEYTYLLESSQWEGLHPWYFQQPWPVLWSEVRLRGFEPYRYLSAARPAAMEPLTYQQWVAKYVPPFRPEPYSAGPQAGRQRLHFVLYYPDENSLDLSGLGLPAASDLSRQWTICSQNLEEASRLYEDADKLEAFQALVNSLVRDIPTAREQALRLHAHVRDYLRWNGIFSAEVNRSPSEIYQSRQASSGEVNMLLIQLLYQAGLPVHKVFVPTVGQGKPLTEVPIRAQFNHLIAEVDLPEGPLLLDATSLLLPPDLLPPATLNQAGWRIRPDSAGWRPLPHPTHDLTRATIHMQWPHPDSQVQAEAVIVWQGYAAWRQRQARQAGQDLLAPLRPEGYRFHGTPQRQGADSLPGPVRMAYELRQPPPPVQAAGARHFFPGQVVALPLPALPAGPRTQPVDLESLRSWEVTLSFLIPPGYRVAPLPQPQRITLPGQEAVFELRCEAGADLVLWQVSGRFGTRLLPAAYAGALQEWTAAVADRLAEPLILIPD